MSANFITMKVPGSTIRKDVVTTFEAAQDSDRYENGHSYSGGFGMVTGLSFPSKTFETEAAAEEWLGENCQKWKDALCVTVKDEAGAMWLIGAWCAS